MKLIADLHVHTVSSGHAYSTLEEYVAAAKKIGLQAIAITDHGPKMPGGAHDYHFSNMRMIPEVLDGIRVFKGIESNIINEKGKIDLPTVYMEEIDIVMVAFHQRCGYENQGEEKNTKVLLRAMENPKVNVLAHPGNPFYPVNIKEIVKAAKKRKILLEINNSSFTSRKGSWERCLEFAREIKRVDWKVLIGSDAHISTMLGDFDQALKLIAEAGLTEKYVVNTSLNKIERYLLKDV